MHMQNPFCHLEVKSKLENFNKFYDEFIRVMERFQYLRVYDPHFALSKNTQKRLDRLAWVLDRYPNVYTDISFGWHTFHKAGFESFSKWKTRSHNFLEKSPQGTKQDDIKRPECQL